MSHPIASGKVRASRQPRKPIWQRLRDFLLKEDREFREARRYESLDAAARRDMGLPPRTEPPRLPGGPW
ncbi:hypothetical protein [Alloyangia pacifica]|uniref:hypothetical protein n=1 Tax=Alloyangia pacifica TaxID=311180 RepID=UPI001CFC80FC|nr:hypothetical protein [Alloyangia pacifica]